MNSGMGIPPPFTTPTTKSRSKLLLWLSLLGLGILLLVALLGRGAFRNYKLASAAVDHFHQQLDQGDYDAIYDGASDEFHRSSDRLTVVKFMGKVHERMGNSSKASSAGFHVNWRNGHTFVDEVLKTQFFSGQAQETFIWISEQDQLRLYSYHIDSPNIH